MLNYQNTAIRGGTKNNIRENIMPIIHFLNVKEGDCSIIEHSSGHISIIDVCNARKIDSRTTLASLLAEYSQLESATPGNFNQKKYPVNPIQYMKSRDINTVFRFVLTHPDMDHMDGIKDFFEEFSPTNFYDTNNNKEIDSFEEGKYRKDDWEYYKKIRDNSSDNNPKRLTLYSGDNGPYRTQGWDKNPPGDAFYVLSPTIDLVKQANDSGDYNDCSYVILYRSPHGSVLFSGDSHDEVWTHLIENHRNDISDIDLFIAPHHGRKSNRNYDYLDIVRPKLTLFGNARSEHLAYNAWNSRGLNFITNNQANCIIVDGGKEGMPVFVTNETFARTKNTNTFESPIHKAWYIYNIK